MTSDASSQGGANNGRIACVDVVALPLQLLWHRHPDWKDEPMAVVDRDEPNGTIEWANKVARRQQVRPGMRYAEAVSLCRSLRAGTVKDEEVAQATDHLEEVLRDWSPFVEPADERTGIFWLDAAGMQKLHDSMQAWAEGLADALLEKESFYVSIVVGFTRFGTWAAARASRGQTVFESPGDERETAQRVPLYRLNLSTSVCRDLEKLGVERLGEFLELPPGGLRRRFGPQVLELHRRARGDLQMPLQGSPDEGPIERRIELEEPATVTSRLVFAIKRALNPILAELADRETRIARIGEQQRDSHREASQGTRCFGGAVELVTTPSHYVAGLLRLSSRAGCAAPVSSASDYPDKRSALHAVLHETAMPTRCRVVATRRARRSSSMSGVTTSS